MPLFQRNGEQKEVVPLVASTLCKSLCFIVFRWCQMRTSLACRYEKDMCWQHASALNIFFKEPMKLSTYRLTKVEFHGHVKMTIVIKSI